MRRSLILSLFILLIISSCTTTIKYVLDAQYVDASEYGFTEENPDVNILIRLLKENRNIVIPSGRYELSHPIRISEDFCVEKLLGRGRQNTVFVFESSDGFILEKGIELADLFIVGENCKGKWNKDLSVFECGYSGIDVRQGRCYLHDVDVYTFCNGLNIEYGHVISGTFERIILAYNGNAGLNLNHTSEAQKNNLVFRSIYTVKNGYDSDNLESLSTGLESGHGILIRGGYGNLFEACVAEYNTGCGLYIKESTPQSTLMGNTILSTYYERNKYANAYVEIAESKSLLNNLSILGSFYTEAGKTLVSNACQNRELVLVNAESINSNWTNAPSINVEGGKVLFTPKQNELFFSNYQLAKGFITSKSMNLLFDEQDNPIIVLNRTRGTVSENNWLKSIADLGIYDVVVTAKTTASSPYRLIVQIRVGDDNKVFSKLIDSSEYKTYNLGEFECARSSAVVMTGTYATPEIQGEDAIFISDLNIVKR